MNYTSEDKDDMGHPLPRGEICYRGTNVFKGYFNQPEATKETIDAEGWVHTGDIGVIQANGSIKIIDRKKNIYKLSQGEYIIPDKLEGKFNGDPYVHQIFVYGDSLQNNLVAIVIPEQKLLEKWAVDNSIDIPDYENLLKDERVKKFFLDTMRKLGKEAGFFGFEIPLKVHLSSYIFTVENDCLTPTFKLKRDKAK